MDSSQPLIIFFKYKFYFSIGSPSVGLHKPLIIFLNIGLPSIGSPHFFNFFSKYGFHLYKFPLISLKTFPSIESFIFHEILKEILLSTGSFTVPSTHLQISSNIVNTPTHGLFEK